MTRLIVTIAIALGGCATGVDPESGNRGGEAGSLGSAGAATGGASGATGSGGDPTFGGASGVGGSSTGGSGGSTATGGSSSGGTSGSTSTGGSGGSSAGSGGSSAGTGGSATGGSSGTGPLVSMWTFDNDLQGWAISYSEPASIAGMTAASWDSAVGDPARGSAKLDIPFASTSQKLDFSIALPATNLSGKSLSARVRLDSGLSGDTNNPGGAKLYVKSGTSYVYADGGWNNMDASKGWVTLTLNVSSPSGFVSNPAQYSASDIREIGIEFATGSSGSSYTTGHVHVDTVGY